MIYPELALRGHVAAFDPGIADNIPGPGVAYGAYRVELVAALAKRGSTLAFIDHLLDQPDRPPELVKLRRFRAGWTEGSPGGECPYPGLAAYQSDDHTLFFGRGRESEALRDLLEQSRWLWVDGASGVGKSSLVAAGLLPLLPARAWVVVRMRPGVRPLENLARALHVAFPGHGSIAALSGELAIGDGLRSFVRQHTPDGVGFLLWLDQLEEAYTFAEREQARLLDAAVAGALDDEEPRFHLVTTIRIDQVGDLLDGMPELGRRINLAWVRRYSLRPIDVDELPDVIERPALAAGRRFQNGLAATIRDEAAAYFTASSEGGLPLLAHTLRELWFACADQAELDGGIYRQIGGFTGALTRSAEKTLAELTRIDPSAGERVQRLLLALTTVDRRRQWTRQTIARARALEVLGGDRAAAALLAGLSGQVVGTTAPLMRLIVTAGEGEHGRIDLIHEALLSRWTTLNGWLVAAEEAKRRSAELHEAALLWKRYKYQDYALSSGGMRESHLEAAPSEEDGALDRAFQSALQARNDAEQRQRWRWLRRASALIVVLLTLIVLLSIQWYSARTGKFRLAQQSVVLAEQKDQLVRINDAVNKLIVRTITQSRVLKGHVARLQSEGYSEQLGGELVADLLTHASTLARTQSLLSGAPTSAEEVTQSPGLVIAEKTGDAETADRAPEAPPRAGAVRPEPASGPTPVEPTPTVPLLLLDKQAGGASNDPPQPAAQPQTDTAPTTNLQSDALQSTPGIDCEGYTRQVNTGATVDDRIRVLEASLDCIEDASAIASDLMQRRRLQDQSRLMLQELDGILRVAPDLSSGDRLLNRFRRLPGSESMRPQLDSLRDQFINHRGGTATVRPGLELDRMPDAKALHRGNFQGPASGAGRG